MKNRSRKTRIPAHALDGLLGLVRAVRTKAITPRLPVTPEDHHREQLAEGRRKAAEVRHDIPAESHQGSEQ